MAVRLTINKQHIEAKEETILHSIPCKIHGDEIANVSKYFTPYIRKNDDKNFDGSFRGYPLNGTIIKIPEGYKGVTFYEQNKPEDPKIKRELVSTGGFTNFTYWNYDKLPSKNDAIIGALNWIDIAEALHSTTDDDADVNGSS